MIEKYDIKQNYIKIYLNKLQQEKSTTSKHCYLSIGTVSVVGEDEQNIKKQMKTIRKLH